jgi:TonB-linked SusC/RagA family outer membrane protein
LLVTGIGSLWAQSAQVSGIVTENGASLPGVSVTVKGTTTGVITDDDGRYSIAVPQNATLVFSFIGMKTQEIVVGTRSVINVQMEADATILGDVVVTGYGTQKKGTVTGSVQVVKSTELEQIPVASFSQALQGRAPGVQVLASSGRPSANAYIRIRGVGSINAGTEPLYVIDGVPSASIDFAALNTNDIESISILKDASATSIYGSRGANGVVVITTKLGASGKAKFDVRALFGVTTPTTNKFNMMDAKEKLTYEKMVGVGLGATMTDAEIESYPINTNWFKEIFKPGFTQQYDMSASGGTEKTRYYVSGQYYNIKSIVYGSDMERISGRVNLDTELSSKLKFGLNLGLGYSKEHVVRSDRNALNPINYVYSVEPWTVPFNPDGSYHVNAQAMDSGINIFENIDNNPYWISVLRGTGGAFLEYKIIPSLKFRTTIGADFRQTYSSQFNYPESTLSVLLGGGGFRADNFGQTFSYNWTNNLTFEETFADVHNVTLSAVTETIQYSLRALSAEGQGMPNSRADALGLVTAEKNVGGYSAGYSMLSFFLRGAYDYDNKYLVDALIRTDGSSRFGPDKRWGMFWSVGLGWNMHKETFLLDQDVISRLKLIASYGTTGNDQIGNYAWRGVFSAGQYNDTPTFYQASLANNSLSWEINTKLSGGVEFGFLEDRITGTIEGYYNKTSDLLLAAQLSRTSGFSARVENVGEMSNSGIEFSINADIVKNVDWLVSAGFSISHNKNRVDKLYSDDFIDTGAGPVVAPGYPLYVYRLTHYAGVNPGNGDALFYDANGNITNVNDAEANDVIIDGKTPFPTVYGSFNFSIGWKNFDLSANIYYNYGNWIYNNVAYFSNSDGRFAATNNQDKRLLYDSWKQPGDITDIPLQRPDIGYSAAGTTRFLEDGSYIRLRDVTLSYKLPKKVTDKLRMNSVRIYAQAHNLFTITKFTGFDPEVGVNGSWAGGSSALAGSGNDYNYPSTRIFSFGIDLSF